MFGIKKILLMVTLVFSTSSFALNIENVLSDDAKSIVGNAQEILNLDLSEDKKIELYEFFKIYVENGGTWNLQPISHNTAVANSKVSDHQVLFLDYVLSYQERLVYITITNFSDKKQWYIVPREVVPVSTGNVLNFYKNYKEDKEYVTLFDQENYSMFQKKGYIDFVNIHVNKTNSVITYSSSNVLNY